MNEPTTTNAAESFHSRYNYDHTAAHPNIHVTVQALLDQQEETYLIERTIRAGIGATLRPERIRMQEQTIEKWESYQNQEISLAEYVTFVGNLKSLKPTGDNDEEEI